MSQQYTEQEAEAILRLAVQKSGETISKDRLASMAAELGVSPDDLAKAEQTYIEKQAAEEERRQLLREKASRSFGVVLVWSVLSASSLILGGWQALSGPSGVFWAAYFIAALTLFSVVRLTRILTAPHSSSLRRRRSTTLTTEAKQVLDDLALREPTKIEAIKELRDRLGLSLRDAKDSVESYDRQNGHIFTHRR